MYFTHYSKFEDGLCDGSHAVKKEDRPGIMQIAKKLVYAESEKNFDEDWLAFSQTPEAQKYDHFTRYDNHKFLLIVI